MRYFAFISYNYRDRACAEWLQRRLESYRVPRHLAGVAGAPKDLPRRLMPVFRDRDELAASSDLSKQVSDALAESRYLIVLCSPNSAQSRWVNEEVLSFKRCGRAAHIRCVIPDGVDSETWAPDACFCPALRFLPGEDGELSDRPAAEPLAADLRAGQDGRGDGLLKLVAGILGVGFDALKQRELRRRRKRTAIAAALSVLVAVAVVVAGWQWQGSRTAQRHAQARALVNEAANLSAGQPALATHLLLAAHALLPDADRTKVASQVSALMRQGVMYAISDGKRGGVYVSGPNDVAFIARPDQPGELWRLNDAQVTVLDGEIESLSFSPDAQQRYALVRMADRGLVLLNSVDAAPVLGGGVRSIALGTQRLVVDYSDGREAELRRLSDLAVLARLPADLQSFRFSDDPQQRYLLAGDAGAFDIGSRRLQLFSADDGRLISDLAAPYDWLDIAEYGRFVGSDATLLAVRYTELPQPQMDEAGAIEAEKTWRFFRTTDGASVFDVEGEATEVLFGSDHVIVTNSDGPPTLRAATDGRELAELQLDSRRLTFDRVWFDPGDAYFLATYRADPRIGEYPAQLWRVRDRRVIAAFDSDVDAVRFARSGGRDYVFARATAGRSEVYRIDDSHWRSMVRDVFFAPGYRVESFAGRSSEWVWTDGKRVTLDRRVSGAAFSDDPVATLAVLRSLGQDGKSRTELWRAGGRPALLLDAGTGVVAQHFDLQASRLLLHYASGRVALIDVDWLQAQADAVNRESPAGVAEVDIASSEALFCARPWLSGLVDSATVTSYLGGMSSRICPAGEP